MCKREDSVPLEGTDEIVTSCTEAERQADLDKADVITRKGVLLECVRCLVVITLG